ncbi:GFO/IDH/MocA family oxidoreductase [Schizosaccharomyces japonicus yFS275]|uniref:GFO/IDH/MocA family oxidoreductase n=1 Tax=Schizosaccharomyces japonicus (strain yFS275 / FY16936) TaxID=402676 RepID=B6K1P3_SCHJY|nr:GFO/IDH/MocA family oxidoreductase [Schizosaccharomyces japonicus yFS275]EEB07074.1 GFO/IDH/MocA family oxidoreductase [Schizosaccharomyces japonicus yFS275]
MARIKVAVLGTGVSASIFHFPYLEALPKQYELYACWERRATETYSKAKEKYPNIKVFTNVDELLADTAIELVVVSLPPACHEEIVTKALNAHKHVVCEKPFTETVEEAKKLFELADKVDRLLCVYQNRRWDGDYMTVKNLIESGRLGQIVEFESHFDRYSVSLGSKKSWKGELGYANGLLYGIGSHLIDQAIALFGEPVGVTAKVMNQRQFPPLGLDDYYYIVLHYSADNEQLPTEVILRSTFVAPGYTPRFIVRGTKGTFVKEGFDPQEKQIAKGMKPDDPAYGKDHPDNYGSLWYTDDVVEPDIIKETVPTTIGDYRFFYRQIAKCIENNDRSLTPVPPQHTLSVQRVISASIQGSASGESVTFDTHL